MNKLPVIKKCKIGNCKALKQFRNTWEIFTERWKNMVPQGNMSAQLFFSDIIFVWYLLDSLKQEVPELKRLLAHC